MPVEFKFPDVGEGITEGEIVRWRVKEGDTVKVGETLATIGAAGEKVSDEEKQPSKEEKAALASIPKKSTSVVGEIPEGERIIEREETNEEKMAPSDILVTPAVRRLAKDMHVNLETVKGTGLEGRITEEDVRKVAEQKGVTEPTPAAKVSRKYDFYGFIERVPLKGVRKVIAERMKEASAVPHVTHMDEADVTELVQIREKEKLRLEKEGVHLTYLPFVIKAVIHALKEHPYVNASLDDEHGEIILKKYYNIGIAVDTPDGLIVPVVKEADSKSIIDISKEIESLAEKANKRALDLADLKGGTFTITNIGVIGGLHATPIINYPEASILALGRIRDELKLNSRGRLETRKILPVSLSFDHRILDGAEAARFVNRLKGHVENPSEILIDRD